LPVPPTPRDREALEQAIIGKATNLLSNARRLASFLWLPSAPGSQDKPALGRPV